MARVSQPALRGLSAKALRPSESGAHSNFHVVFTLLAQIADIAYHNKAVIYDLLFKASAETLITIATDLQHLGVRISIIRAAHLNYKSVSAACSFAAAV